MTSTDVWQSIHKRSCRALCTTIQRPKRQTCRTPLPHERAPTTADAPITAAAISYMLQDLSGCGQKPSPSCVAAREASRPLSRLGHHASCCTERILWLFNHIVARSVARAWHRRAAQDHGILPQLRPLAACRLALAAQPLGSQR